LGGGGCGCLNDKRPTDLRKLLRHTPSLGRSKSRYKGSEKKIRSDNNSNATADAENNAFLTECSQYTERAQYLISGLLARNLLNSQSFCWFLDLVECAELFYTL